MREPILRTSIRQLGGRIVDVGAGGEAVIARACESDTVSTDISKEEIREAKLKGASSQWVLSDACNMPFANKVFDVATLFFSLMYIKTHERKRMVLMETKRVLKSGGTLHLWDTIVEEKPDPYIIQVKVILPNGEKISAGYGVGGKGKEQNAGLVQELAEEARLKAVVNKSHGNLLEFSFKA